jgi:Acetyltransferase (GNAT) domain
MTAKYLVLRDFPEPHIELSWRSFLEKGDMPSHYCAPEFFREPFWEDKLPFAVLALDRNRIVGVATALRDDREFSSGLPCRPQICLPTGPDREQAESALVQGLLSEAESSELVSIYSWNVLSSPLALGFRGTETKGAVMLDLTKGPDALFREFSADKRRNIRFSIKNGVEVQQATTREDLLDFYDVYLAWRGTDRKEIDGPQIPLSTFERAFALTENRLVLMARHSGKVIATNTFRFYPGGLFESAANYSRPENVHLKPNELLQWRGIEWACRHNLQRHSLGGTHSFLRGFGRTIAPVYRYRLDRTFLRQHDLRDAMSYIGDEWRKRMPKPVKQQVRRILAKF